MPFVFHQAWASCWLGGGILYIALVCKDMQQIKSMQVVTILLHLSGLIWPYLTLFLAPVILGPRISSPIGASVAMAGYVPFILFSLAWFSAGVCGAKMPKKDLDMSTGLREKDWFVASEHLDEIGAYCQQWEGLRSLHLFDFFSHSRRVSCSFEGKGFRARSYDIRSSPSEDILSRAGFYLALHCVLQSSSCRTRSVFNSTIFWYILYEFVQRASNAFYILLLFDLICSYSITVFKIQ